MSADHHPALPFDVVLLARLEEGSARNENTGCLEWRRQCSDGYGLMSYRGKVRTVHRLSWEAHFGPIPRGRFVCHVCDNPPCLAIEHLFLGTAKQNVADMHRKGRARQGPTVLNEPLVAEMKRRFCLGESAREVATALGLVYATVHGVKAGYTWKRVPPAAAPMNLMRPRVSPAPVGSTMPAICEGERRQLESIRPKDEIPRAQHKHAGGGFHVLSRLSLYLRRLGRAAGSGHGPSPAKR